MKIENNKNSKINKITIKIKIIIIKKSEKK